MNDIRQRFRSLDRIAAPDLWSEVTRRASVPSSRSAWALIPMNQFAMVAVLGAAAIAIVVAASVLMRPPNVGPPSPQTPSTTPPATTAGTGAWIPAQPMGDGREDHTATLLRDGHVLVAGGSTDPAELYDPSTGSWTPTGSLVEARGGHTATLLADGRVLVAGGFRAGLDNNGEFLGSAELYDPVVGTWTPTRPMVEVRGRGHTATLLSDGRVLVAGGFHGAEPTETLSSAEIFDPASNAWTAMEGMNRGRSYFTATMLRDGTVLVAGGLISGASAELFDPSTGAWSTTGSMVAGRHDFTATLLADGTVLAAGGEANNSAELYDPESGAWTEVGSMVGGPQIGGHTASLLADGSVLVAGVVANAGERAQVYDPGTRTWTAIPDMGTPRGGHTATLLPDGTVLIAGGRGVTDTAELYVP